MNIEHHQITRTFRTGYPNVVAQPEHFGTDYFGDEVLEGDDYIEDTNTDEIILKDNLEKYLEEVYDFKFQTAE
ncbi:MAG TPA: hypothetical protein GX497_12775 [Bacillus bacterium]|nr:hypothetical protein [Bacillus sp. (in: firmicutes)]